MKKVKIKEEEKQAGETIEHYKMYKGFPVVKFSSGLQLGKKKIKAVLENKEALEQFARGDFDEILGTLTEGEVLEP